MNGRGAVNLRGISAAAAVVAIVIAMLLALTGAAGARGGGGSGSAPCGNGTVTWDPAVLWPPNHKMVPVTISWTENKEPTEVLPDQNTLSADSVSSVGVDDKGSGQPTKKQGPDYSGVPTTSSSVPDGQAATVTVYLRAERSGTDKAGRTYTVNLTCKSGDDPDGHAMAVVTVPHDMGNQSSGASARKGVSVSLRTLK
jgi:hypothetical protein